MITKAKFLAAISCGRAGWYAQRAPRAPLTHADRWAFHVGNRVGALARAHLGDGIVLPYASHERALEQTDDALHDPHVTLVFEATFAVAHCVARADALRRADDGWELIEVKSGKMPEDGTSTSEDYLDDVAYTLTVARAAGINIVRATLMLLNREYTLGAAQQFGTVDVTERANARAIEFAANLHTIVETLLSDTPPAAHLQSICKKCDHFATKCIGVGIDDSILRIPNLRGARFDAIQPFARIRALPLTADLTAPQQRVARIIATNSPHRDARALADLQRVVWPAYYLDFETVMPAIPWFAGDTPYTTIPNQYSIHVCGIPGDVAHHAEYLAAHTYDWRRELTERMLHDLGNAGSILVYSSYEKIQLNAMADWFPHLADQLHAVVARLFDLEKVFKNAYVHPGYAGSSSIKKVLPVLVPHLSYDAMDVGNGSDASALFSLMHEGVIDASEHAAHRIALREYCALDTRAMVELHAAALRV